MVMVINDLHRPSLFTVNQPSHSDKQLSMVKAMCVVKGQGHIWPSKFKGQGHGQGQTHWSHLRPGVDSIYMFAFCFVAIGPLLVEILQIPYLPLKIQGPGHGQGHIWWSHLRPWVKWICLLFVSWQSDHFWLRCSKFHIWSWKFKVKVTTKMDQNLIR